MNTISKNALNAEQKAFLVSLAAEFPLAEGDAGIPVYLVDPGTKEPSFISDFPMATKANRRFEKEAPAGLYRGGAVILVRWNGLTLTVWDDRYCWHKPFAGIALFAEGDDLTKTGKRELVEEAFIASLNRQARVVPRGSSMDLPLANCLNVTVGQLLEVGEVKVVDYTINEQNRALEAVLGWDISGIELPFTVTLEEDWFAGGHSGVTVLALNQNGSVAGYFSGQQGFVDLPAGGPAKLHPTLERYISSETGTK